MKKAYNFLLINWLRVRVPPESHSRCEKSEDTSSIFAFLLLVKQDICSKTALSGLEPERSCRFHVHQPTAQHFEEISVIGCSCRFDSRFPLRAKLKERRRVRASLSAFSHLAFAFFLQRAKVAVKRPQNADLSASALVLDPPLLIGGSVNPPFSHNSNLLPEGVALWL